MNCADDWRPEMNDVRMESKVFFISTPFPAAALFLASLAEHCGI